MADASRLEPPAAGAVRRWTLGLHVSSDCGRMSAALVAATGQGLAMRPEVGEGIAAQLPRETAALFARLVDASAAATAVETAETLAALRAHLADHQAALIDALLAQAGVPPGRVLAVGVVDPGLWGGAGAGGYLGLCDPARLAELTGMNVVDALPARDVARGGQGGPLTAAAEWMFLNSPRRSRLLLRLGRTTRLTWMPRNGGPTGGGLPHLLSFDVGPGTRMLDLLVERLTGGEHRFDVGGSFAVQGRRVGELIEHWLADPYFRRSVPRWHPRGVRPERFLVDAMQMAVDAGWSVRDLLCTATHFIAESIHLAVRKRLPEDAAIDEIVLAGGGRQNGMLLREIARQFPDVPTLHTNDLGIASEALPPACAGLLALFHLDQVPANSPEVTGAEVARVLGRLTPGSPQSWQRLLAELTGSKPAVRPLRSAL